jgi:hypothetical protein
MLSTVLEKRKPLTALDLKNHATPRSYSFAIRYLTYRMKSYPISPYEKDKDS